MEYEDRAQNLYGLPVLAGVYLYGDTRAVLSCSGSSHLLVVLASSGLSFITRNSGSSFDLKLGMLED